MSALLLLLASLPSDVGFDAYAQCANSAAISYKDSADSLDVLIGRVEENCAAPRAALLEAAPDREHAMGWIRTTTALALSEEVAALRSPVSEARADAAAAPTSTASDFPKLEAYRLCGADHAAKIVAEAPNLTAEAIAAEATMECEPQLKAAADETVERMRQPGLRKQVIADFRRRTTANLIQTIITLRASGK